MNCNEDMTSLSVKHWVVGVLTGIMIIYIYKRFSEEVSYVESIVDKREYKIRVGKQKSKEYKVESADKLAEINKRIEILTEHLDYKYNGDPVKGRVARILKEKYSPDILSEAANDKRYTTFTVDKKDMHICLRTRDSNEKMYDINLLMYVVLHELAHFVNYDKNGEPIIGHGREFMEIFRMLVSESMMIGIYQYTNYAESPVEYCGMYLSSSIV
jgi:hypothetical protein